MAEGETVLTVHDLRQDVRAPDGKIDRLDQKVDGVRRALRRDIGRLGGKVDRVGRNVQTTMWVVLAGLLVTILVQALRL